LESEKLFLTLKLKMEFNKDNDKNGGDENEQLRGSARKRKLNNELTNNGDGDKPAEEDQPELEDCSSSKKNREDGNGLDLEVCTYLDLEKAKINSIDWGIPSLIKPKTY
jgi:hypothetical protein